MGDWPVQLVRVKGTQDLALKTTSSEIFENKPVVVPTDQVMKQGYFSVTYQRFWDIDMVEDSMRREGINGANAIREIRTREFVAEDGFTKMNKATFQSYSIPEEMAEEERGNSFALADSCTS